MSAEILTVADCGAELVAGSGGVFDVFADEKLIFSKLKVHRFPEEGEIAALINL